MLDRREFTCLHRAFHKVQALVDKQNKSPFLKRYLKRDEIIKQIAACGDDLIDALQLFGVSSWPINCICC